MQDLSFAVTYVSELLNSAIRQRASDIHCDPFAESIRIRFRIDGLLQDYHSLPCAHYLAIIARLKTLAALDIAQQRLPQDGRFHWQQQHFRIHTCPSLHGEKMVIRLLPALEQQLSLDKIGLLPTQLTCVKDVLTKRSGIIIVTGPTGSGKTMTLYACLQFLIQQPLQIITLEDPVEIALPGISQIPVRKDFSLAYADLLKAILRQDPDVIMIGEIRDNETAHVAIRAALTGHLVLSTLHTPNAMGCIQRLHQMGIASYHLADSLNLVIAQRLVRMLCPTGMQGRTGLFECLTLTPNMRHLLQDEDWPTRIQLPENFISMRDAGLIKVKENITTEEELRDVS